MVKMKRTVLVLLLVLSVFSSINAALAEKKGEFYLYLGKLGTDEIRFSDSVLTTGSVISSHVFPLISGSEPTAGDDGRTVSSTIYLHWIHQSEESNVSIELSFVAKESEDAKNEAGYMLYKENSSDTTGLNYQVDFLFANEDENTTLENRKLKSITFDNKKPTSDEEKSDLVSAVAAGGRFRKFSIDDNTYQSPLTITMTVSAPYDKYGTTYRKYWMEAQYGGYIKAVVTNK